MSVRLRFTEEELEAARQATARAERATGVEVVAVVVDRCDDYPQALWLAATLGAIAAALVAAAGHLTAGLWAGPPEVWILLPPLVGAAAGYLVASLSATARRLLVPDELLRRRSERRAAEAFIDEEIFATADRTGVLLLVGLFEHRAVVLADRGLHQRVPEGSWEKVASGLAVGIRAGRPGAALVSAIDECGRLAEESGLGRRSDDRNELDDKVRFPDG